MTLNSQIIKIKAQEMWKRPLVAALLGTVRGRIHWPTEIFYEKIVTLKIMG